MKACEVFEVDADSKEAIPEKRTYKVEDIQIILDIGRGTAYKLLEPYELSRHPKSHGIRALLSAGWYSQMGS